MTPFTHHMCSCMGLQREAFEVSDYPEAFEDLKLFLGLGRALQQGQKRAPPPFGVGQEGVGARFGWGLWNSQGVVVPDFRETRLSGSVRLIKSEHPQ